MQTTKQETTARPRNKMRYYGLESYLNGSERMWGEDRPNKQDGQTLVVEKQTTFLENWKVHFEVPNRSDSVRARMTVSWGLPHKNSLGWLPHEVAVREDRTAVSLFVGAEE